MSHPCPTPTLGKRQRFDGLLWACKCGKVHAYRFVFNYAGEWWEWQEVRLSVDTNGESDG